jgi:rhodanese-related sulfurtransferase
MPVDIDSPEGHIIRKMVPFSTMPNSIFKVICDKIMVETARSGAFLFKRGDTKKELIYLLKGEVSLEVDKLKMEVIKSGTESARFALAHQLPRKVNGVAKGTVQFLRLNSIYITTPDLSELKKDSSSDKETDKETKQNWMSTLLMVPVLRALPPAQLSKINENLEEVEYLESQIIVKQGEVGEYYYLIKSGECVLSHKDATPEQALTVTKLKIWDSFGAEALICHAVRNHTATALTDVSLLRMKKDKFFSLIKEPLIKVLNESETEALLHNNGILLDVRSEAKFEQAHFPEAVNAPLLGLRNYLKKLESNQPIVVISDEQSLSEAAAFLLLSYKFSAYVSQKSIEKAPAKLSINIRQPANHSFSAAVISDDNDVSMDLLMDDEEQAQNDKMVISTRSASNHTSPQDLLAAENASLRKHLKELKLRAEKAEHEKQEISQKYQQLWNHTERLKQMLQSLTK